jgi:hypothetical protein
MFDSQDWGRVQGQDWTVKAVNQISRAPLALHSLSYGVSRSRRSEGNETSYTFIQSHYYPLYSLYI